MAKLFYFLNQEVRSSYVHNQALQYLKMILKFSKFIFRYSAVNKIICEASEDKFVEALNIYMADSGSWCEYG